MNREMRLNDDEMKRTADQELKKESYENGIDSGGMKDLLEAEERRRETTISPNFMERYSAAFYQAEQNVMQLVGTMEKRLANRESTIIDNLQKLMDKRPKTIAIVFTRGKAARTWQKAIATQKKALHRVQKRKETVTAIRSRRSDYHRNIQSWIRKRALKIDAEAIRKHEETRERQRHEEEKARLEAANEFARLKAQHLEKGRQQANCLERKIS